MRLAAAGAPVVLGVLSIGAGWRPDFGLLWAKALRSSPASEIAYASNHLHATGERAERLISAIYDLGGIGYVALCSGQDVLLRPAPGPRTTTTEESNFYEELLVNPTLLKLASQRANLDCEGLRYTAIGYGKFVELIMLMKGGHVSIGVSRKADAGGIAARVQALLEAHGQAWEPPTPWLLA